MSLVPSQFRPLTRTPSPLVRVRAIERGPAGNYGLPVNIPSASNLLLRSYLHRRKRKIRRRSIFRRLAWLYGWPQWATGFGECAGGLPSPAEWFIVARQVCFLGSQPLCAGSFGDVGPVLLVCRAFLRGRPGHVWSTGSYPVTARLRDLVDQEPLGRRA